MEREESGGSEGEGEEAEGGEMGEAEEESVSEDEEVDPQLKEDVVKALGGLAVQSEDEVPQLLPS